MTERIRLSRAKGWRKPDGVVNCARPSRYGNPVKVGSLLAGVPVSALQAVSIFHTQVYRRPWMRAREFQRYPTLGELRAELEGCSVACWCGLDQPCHADVLLVAANPEMELVDWLVSIGTSSAIVPARTVTEALLVHGGHAARPATEFESAVWWENVLLERELRAARSKEDRRQVLGVVELGAVEFEEVQLFGGEHR